MIIPFSKMQALGNDFVVLDGVSRTIPMQPSIAAQIADRHFGIGCDQILLVEAAFGNADFTFRIFNYDGSEVAQCGNGARCLALFLKHNNLWDAAVLRLQTATTCMRVEMHADQSVSVNLGTPQFTPHLIPLAVPHAAANYTMQTSGGEMTFAAVSMGNPHAVFEVAAVASAPVVALGAELQQHAWFPQRVNVGFMQVRARDRIDLRVFERGVGETLGCGSGACAAVVAGINNGRLDEAVTVSLPGGEVTVRWAGGDAAVWLRGPAHTVFTGQIEIADWQ